LVCVEPTVDLKMFYKMGESLSLDFSYKGSFITLYSVILRYDVDKNITLIDPHILHYTDVTRNFLVAGSELNQITGKEVSFIYSFIGCDDFVYTNEGNLKEPFVFHLMECFGWTVTPSMDVIDVNGDSVKLSISVQINEDDINMTYSLYQDGNPVKTSFTLPADVEISAVFNGMEDIKLELFEECGGSNRSILNKSLSAGGHICDNDDVCDVFVSILSVKERYENYILPNVTLIDSKGFTVTASSTRHRDGGVWRLCKGEKYSFEQMYAIDRVVIETRDEVLYDTYDEPYQSGGKFFTVKCNSIPNECKLDDTFEISLEYTEGSSVTVEWDEKEAKDAIFDIFDNGVLVKSNVKGNTGGASFKLFSVQQGDSHDIAVREQCSGSAVSKHVSLLAAIPCNDHCTLFMYETVDYKSGYVTISSKDDPDLVYFVGAPSFDSSTSDETVLTPLQVCSSELSVNLVLPPDVTSAGDEGHRFIIAENNTENIVKSDGGKWIVSSDSIVKNTTFNDGAEEFEFVCEACYRAIVGNHSLDLDDDGKEVLRFSDVRSIFGYLYVSVNGKTEKLTVGSEKNISIKFDSILAEYCFAYATCDDRIDQSNATCLESSYCAEPTVSLSVEHGDGEVLSLSLDFDLFYASLVSLEEVNVMVDNDTIARLSEHYCLSCYANESDDGFSFFFNETSLPELFDSLRGKEVCFVYSFNRCGHEFANSDEPLCVFVEVKSKVPLIVGCVFGALVGAALLAGLIAFLIKRPRGESKEMDLEMEFPEDNEPVMDDDGPFGNPHKDSPSASASPSPSGSASDKDADNSESASHSPGESGSDDKNDDSKSDKSSKEQSHSDDADEASDDESVSVSSASDDD